MHRPKSPRFNKTQSFMKKVTSLGFKKITKCLKITISQIHLFRIANTHPMQVVLAQGKILTLVLFKNLKWGIEWKTNLIFRWILIMMRLIKREISHLLLYLHIKRLTDVKADNKGQSHRWLLLTCLHYKSLLVNLLMERCEIISSRHQSRICSINNQHSWRV